MARWFSVGNRFSWRRLVLCSLLCFVLLQLYSFATRVAVNFEQLKQTLAHHPLTLQELEQVEEVQLLPPFGLKNPQKINLIEEFLDPASPARSLFFPMRDVYTIDPRKDKDRGFLYPGFVWLDTDGNPIQAHGGGVLFDEKSETYYWYGENKDGETYKAQGTGTARVDVIGISCYSSKDLWAWKNEGIVLAAEKRDVTHDLHRLKVVERPKVVYNDKTGKYVMWMHIDDATYNKASVGIATSDTPTGPFDYLYSRRPNGFDSRDMTVFKDDDGIAYLISSSVRNKELHISPLNQAYLDVTNLTVRALIGQHREAPAVFKNNGIYYMITSGCSGWLPNEAVVHEAQSILGPWESIGNPCVGANEDYRVATFFSQGTFVLPVPGGPKGSFVFMADTWNPADLRDSRYVWLPLNVRAGYQGIILRGENHMIRSVGLPLWSKVSIFWHKKWKLPLGRENGEVDDLKKKKKKLE